MLTPEQAAIGAVALVAITTLLAAIYTCLRMARRAEDQAEREYRSFITGKDLHQPTRLDRLRVIQRNDPAVARLAARREEQRRASARITEGW